MSKISTNLIRLFCLLLLTIFSFGIQAQTNKGQQGKRIVETVGESIDNVQDIVANAEAKKAKIDEAFKKVTENNLYKTLVDGDAISFPLGILPDNGNSDYALVINELNMDVNGMSAEVYMKVPVGSDKHLYLMADRVPVNSRGDLQLTGDLNLFLLKTIDFEVGKGYDITFKGLDDQEQAYTYATFNCDGFKEIFLNGKLNFKEQAIVKYDSTTQENVVTEKVELHFYANADRLANIVLKFTDVPAFQFKKLPGFKCQAPELTLDFSDLRNAPNFELPSWYLDSLQIKEPNLDRDLYTSPLWEGVYIPLIEIDIPRKFTEGKKDKDGKTGTKEATEIVKVTATDFIVDQYGITALTKATNVLSGNLKGFEYQVDSLRLNVIASSLSKAGFYGQMTFPICKEESTVDYGLTITKNLSDDSQLEYNGYARLETDLEASALGVATLGLTAAALDFKIKNKQFFPKLTIAGSLDLQLKKKDDNEAIGGVGFRFSKFVINTQTPYVDIEPGGYFELKENSDSKLAKLPISINSAKIMTEQGGQKVGLGVNLSVSLQQSNGNGSESSNGFGATTDFVVWTKREAATRRFKFDSFVLNSIHIDADMGAIKIKGSLETFNEPETVYGKGFCGYMEMTVVDKLTVSASATFGRNIQDGYRYWFVDASVEFPTPIMFAPALGFNSFSGGAYKNMEMQGGLDAPANGSKCKTATGRTYLPKEGVFGLLAGVGIQSTGGGSAFNGEINFGLEFFIGSSGSGLKRLATWGNVKVMSEFKAPGLEKVAGAMDSADGLNIGDKKAENGSKDPTQGDDEKASVMLNWFVEYDVPNKTLVGDFDIYLNLAGAVKGIGTNGKAGRISFFTSPDKWYLYIGRPSQDDMIGVDVLGVFKLGGYLCMGSVLPTPPIAPMPPEVVEPDEIDYSLLSLGGGLSFGARLETGDDPSIGIGICNIRAGLEFTVKAGFDVLLSKTNQPIICNNLGPDYVRGFKGWYATGQAYLYGKAEIFAKYKCIIGSGRIKVFSAYLKAYVFAQLPKPTNLKGAVEAGFTVIKWDFKKSFDFEVGDYCSTGEEILTEIDFIDAIYPADDEDSVSTSTSVDVYFSERIYEYEFFMENENQDLVRFRPYVDNNLIKFTTLAGDPIKVHTKMSPDNTQLTITPETVLPGETEFRVIIGVMLQKKQGSGDNVSWAATNNIFSDTVIFKTAKENENIPLEMVEYAYPSVDMKNFYLNESTNGFINLNMLPNNAVTLAPDEEFTVAVYEYNNEIDRTNNVQYINTYGEKNFTFKIPTLSLLPNKNYRFKLMRSKRVTNTTQGSTSYANGQGQIGALDPDNEDFVLLEYDFRTSKYTTFKEKMALYSTSVTEVLDGVITSNLSINDLKDIGDQSFESLSQEEISGQYINGIKTTAPLIQFSELKLDNDLVNSGANLVNSIGSLDLTNNPISSGINLATSVVNQGNDILKQANLQCLLSSDGCSSQDLKEVEIPAGKVSIDVGYYLPGENSANSVHTIFVDLDQAISLPY